MREKASFVVRLCAEKEESMEKSRGFPLKRNFVPRKSNFVSIGARGTSDRYHGGTDQIERYNGQMAHVLIRGNDYRTLD